MTKWCVVRDKDGKPLAAGWSEMRVENYAGGVRVDEYTAVRPDDLAALKVAKAAKLDAVKSARASAEAKLKALGLTDAEIATL